jgi:hypothetical protein
MMILRPGQQGALVLAQALHDPLLALRNDAHAFGQGDSHKDKKCNDNKAEAFHEISP